eukprot:CAMPEP_0183308524 /NCGR_PEP_ID=MMETSP0160_2-20130417/22309_1 /TAXON_ID=2839 ORGANISM="Odontella Sinensis, Strain Grunow 1884" /NCGR_SAMPLE_ID=MMETSP0160_2 /ASSEMBLY_ACC=CAM_ASM_000250 /LENGTH=267 /DNA_ID=CAMNT_0025472379 /DNA_START=128 /DNA_END=928 /DNA_ORIENTATION=-
MVGDNDVLPDWEVGEDQDVTTDPGRTAQDWDTGSESGTTQQPTNTQATADEGGSHEKKRRDLRQIIKRDGRLLLITILIVILMNIPFVKWVLYPFTIFSTWIHEMCHGMAALIVGGRIHKLLIFADTSGLAYTSLPPGPSRYAFVVSAGYQGTAVVGFLLLLFRRTKRGPRSGTVALGLVMILSTAIWIRNVFGCIAIPLIGIGLCLCGWKLPSARMRDVYVCVAVTCTWNAITSVHDLFGSAHYVNGDPTDTDAHSMGNAVGGPFW